MLDQQCDFAYYMHADDDSYVRLDLVMQLLVGNWNIPLLSSRQAVPSAILMDFNI